MPLVLASTTTAKSFKDLAREFLEALRSREFHRVWNSLITDDAARLISYCLAPIRAFDDGQIDGILVQPPNSKGPSNVTEALAVAFQFDAEGIRSDFFDGFEKSLAGIGWYDFAEGDDRSFVFVDDEQAVLFAETPITPLIMLFVRDVDGAFRVDMEAVMAFSLAITASKLYKIGLRALELDRRGQALVYFELSASLRKVYGRLKACLTENVIGRQMVTPVRAVEITAEETQTWLAMDQALKVLALPQNEPGTIDLGRFMAACFRGYSAIPGVEVTETDLQLLTQMNDGQLRNAIASILLGVDPVVARREASKPHSPAEISDMEVPVVFEGVSLYLAMPFKSGREIRSEAVTTTMSCPIPTP